MTAAWLRDMSGLECRLGVPIHCLRSNGVIIHMTSHTLHNAATSWIIYYLTFPAGSRGRALVGGLGDEVPQLKVVTSKLYAFLVVIHIQYMKSKHWLLKTKTTKHNSSPQIVRQYELLSSSVWKKWVKQLGTPNVHVSPCLLKTTTVSTQSYAPHAKLRQLPYL